MTPAQLEHLRLIDAHLAKLLDIAAKRTPGEWRKGILYSIDATPTGDITVMPGIARMVKSSLFAEEDAAFIASCAGNAEAGWRATRAAIALCIANLHTDPEFPTHEAGEICDNDGQGCRACGYTERMLLESILAAFPLESLK